MALPDSYTQKPGAIPAYFDAVLNAQAPDRFSNRFLTNLGFKSTNDRLFIGILKDLGFLDTDGNPTERYYAYHDRTQSARVIAEAIREAYSDLFEINQEAHKLETDDVYNKLRTLYAGSKTDSAIKKIARTFTGLVEIADFESPPLSVATRTNDVAEDVEEAPEDTNGHADEPVKFTTGPKHKSPVSVESLQYHINIVLPESRDQAVYDAIFKSLREHLG